MSGLTIGAPLPTDELIAKDQGGASFILNSTTDIAVLMLALLVLGITRLLVVLKVNPLAVWATVMGCSAFGWWCFRSDVTTSIVLYCA